MKLYPPEPKVELYKEGFGTNDLLNRKPTGKSLSDLVERIEDPLVIVLDGPWGCGKSYFLRRWVGAHQLENGGSATTVYFDAFANDFLDDPLTGLAGAINEQLPDDTDPKARRILKGAVAKLAKPTVKAGIRALTAGLSDLTGPAVDALLAAGGDHLERAVEDFWRREDGKRAAMKEVEASLKTITAGPDGDEPRKLVIIVDELDRCRPDYALAVLEIIKHFFAVPNVHFVLGVNMAALEHSVSARYGERIDAEGYLRRFTSITMTFQKNDGMKKARDTQSYWLHQGKTMGIDAALLDHVNKQLALEGISGGATIRDINRMLSVAALMDRCEAFSRWGAGYQIVVASVLVMKALQPALFHRVRAYGATIVDIKEFYGIKDKNLDMKNRGNGGYNHVAAMLTEVWQFVLSNDEDEVNETIARSFDGFTSSPSEIDVDQIAREHFDAFAISQEAEG